MSTILDAIDEGIVVLFSFEQIDEHWDGEEEHPICEMYLFMGDDIYDEEDPEYKEAKRLVDEGILEEVEYDGKFYPEHDATLKRGQGIYFISHGIPDRLVRAK